LLARKFIQQFGKVQGMSQGVALYGRRHEDSMAWGPILSYDAACEEYYGLHPLTWEYHPKITKAGVIEEFVQFNVVHRFPWILVPGEPLLGEDDIEDSDDEVVDDGGGGGGDEVGYDGGGGEEGGDEGGGVGPRCVLIDSHVP
jgi:hypothetical protein